MKKVNIENSFASKLKYIFGDFQFVVNTAIDDEDVKQFVMHGFKYILKRERLSLFITAAGLIALIFLSGLLRFLGLCVFIGAISYIGVQMVKFVSGVDDSVFEKIKVELDQEDVIPQKSLTDYVTARINQKKFNRRKS